MTAHFPGLINLTERPSICVLGVSNKESERSFIIVLGATSKESERPYICVLGVTSHGYT
jgi:hypothetical protein